LSEGAAEGAVTTDPSVRSVRAAPLLELEDLRVHFTSKRGTVHAVDGVSFTIDAGETFGLVGETGSGKSVTARSLLRLNPSPPAIHAGGRAMFRPRQPCPRCDGTGCEECDGSGRLPRPCPSCRGTGCGVCSGTGHETVDLLTLSERRIRGIRGNHIAMVFQDPGKALNPALTIRRQLGEVFAEHRSANLLQEAGMDPREANVLLRRDAHGRSRRAERLALALPPLRGRHRRLRRVLDDRIAQALADTRIPNPRKVMDRYPHELSGGMKQRVMIAQALAADPELLIADEPTTALDVTIQARILDLLADLQQRHRMAVLYISHDLSLVRGISDRVAVMYGGQLVEVGSAGELFERPMHPYTRGLLGALPSANQARGTLVAIEGTVPELIDPVPNCRFHTRCPHAAPACERLTPELHAAGARTHPTACFLHDDPSEVNVPPADMPRIRRDDPERVV
jgi:oligopeptide/dipeptide ABC transporter ATP-binding protein